MKSSGSKMNAQRFRYVQTSRRCDFGVPRVPSILQIQLSLLDVEKFILSSHCQHFLCRRALTPYQIWVRHVIVN